MKTRNLIILLVAIHAIPFDSEGQALKKLKKDIKEVVGNAKGQDEGKQQNSSGLFTTKDQSSSSTASSNSEAASTQSHRETIKITFNSKYLKDFEMDAYQGKLLGEESGYGSVIVDDKNHRYKAIIAIMRMSVDNPQYGLHLPKLLSDEGKREFQASYNANEFEKRRVWEKYKSSGLHDIIVETGKSLPRMKEANVVKNTRFNTYDFEKEQYKLLIQILDAPANGRPKIFFHYNLKPEQAEAFAKAHPTKLLYAARERNSYGRGALYSDPELQEKITDYSPGELTVEIGKKEYPYITPNLNSEKLDQSVDVAKTLCIDQYREKIDCECFGDEYRNYMMDQLHSTYHPNIIFNQLEAHEGSTSSLYVVSGPAIRMHFLTSEQKDALERSFKDKDTGVAGPFDLAKLKENLKMGKLTEEIYPNEAFARYYLLYLGSDYNTGGKDDSFCVIR